MNTLVGIKTYKRPNAVKALVDSIRSFEPDVKIYVLDDDPESEIGDSYMNWGIDFYGKNIKNHGSNWSNNQLMREFLRVNIKYTDLTRLVFLDDDVLCTGPFVELINSIEEPHLYIPNPGAQHQMPWGYVLTATKDLLEKIVGS